MTAGFCYLLGSGAGQGRATYIGFTVNPGRRLRQHNGEIVGGAKRTSRRGRPWRMLFVVTGFASRREALQFEWHWTYPSASRHLRNLFAKSMRRATTPRQRAGVLAVMLSNPPWSEANLKVLCTGEGSKTLLERAAAEFHVAVPANDVVSVQNIPAVAGDEEEDGSSSPDVEGVSPPPARRGSAGSQRHEAAPLPRLYALAGSPDSGLSSGEECSTLPLFGGAGAASGKCALCPQQLGSPEARRDLGEPMPCCVRCRAQAHCVCAARSRDADSGLVTCPSCGAAVSWPQLVRATYGAGRDG